MTPYAANSKPFARASLALIGLAWTLPFLQPYHRFPVPSFYAEWLAFALGLGALVALLGREAWADLQVPPISLAALLLAVLAWVQFAAAMMPYLAPALAPSLYLLWAALLAMLGNHLRRELGMERVVVVLAWFLLAGGVLSAAAGILQHYHVIPLVGTVVTEKRTMQVIGNIAQANHFAAYSTLGLVALAYLASRRRMAPALAVSLAAVLTFVGALSGSRSIWLYLAAMLLLAIALRVRAPVPEHRRLVILCACLLPLLTLMHGVAGLSWLAPPELKMLTTLDRLFDVAGGFDARVALWREALSMFASAPWLGVGFGQYAWHHFEYQAAAGLSQAYGLPNNAHNLPLHLAAETGVMGVALVAGGFLYWLAGLRKLAASAELWWLLALLAVIGVHSLLEYPLWHTYFLGIAAIALGLGTTRAPTVRLARIGAPLAALLLAGGLVLATLTLRDFRRMEQLVFKPYRAESEIPGAGTFRDVLVEVRRDPLLTPYVEIAIGFGIEITEDHLAEKLGLLERVTRFAPAPVLLQQRALLLALAGERDAARAMLDKSLRVYPHAAGGVAPRLEMLARRYPGRFEHLIELVSRASSAPRRSPHE